MKINIKNLTCMAFNLLLILTIPCAYAMESVITPKVNPDDVTLQSSAALTQNIRYKGDIVGKIEYSELSASGRRYISHVAIQENLRGQGIGTEAMRKFIQFTKDEDIHVLHLTTTDEGKALYRKLGFKMTHDSGACNHWFLYL